MKYDYTLFIDEAGDDKVKRLKPEHENGNSEWLCLGGYLVRATIEEELEDRRDALNLSISGQRGHPLHFRNLKSFNRIRVCKKLAEFPARAFVVCSYKKTMLGHSNPRAEAKGNYSSNSQYLYNFVVRLLLERVTEFVQNDAKRNGVADAKLRIVMASRKGHHFGHFKAYVLQLIHQAIAKSTFLKTKEVVPELLSFNLIDRMPASTHPGLQLADVAVSSIFQAIEESSPKRDENPALALRQIIASKRRYGSPKLHRQNFGLTLYPANEAEALISARQKSFFSDFGYTFQE